MRDPQCFCRRFARRAALLLSLLLLALAAQSATSATPRAAHDARPIRIADLHAQGGTLRQLLALATGSTPASGRGSASAAASDQIYWDGFELCGDGVIDAPGEQCDRADLGGATCLTAGFTSGTLGCDATCHLDTSQCSGACPTSCATDNDCGVCGPCLQLGGGAGICLH